MLELEYDTETDQEDPKPKRPLPGMEKVNKKPLPGMEKAVKKKGIGNSQLQSNGEDGIKNNPFAIGGQYNSQKPDFDNLDLSNTRHDAAIAEQIKNTPLKKIPLTPILDNTYRQKPISEIDVNEGFERTKQHKIDMETAIDNTTLKVLKNKGIVAGKGSQLYEAERKKIEEKTKPTMIGGIVINGAEATYHKDKDGNIGLDRNLGFIEGMRKSFNDAIDGEDEAKAFSNMTTEQRVQYANQKMQTNPNPEYMQERNSGVGSLIGGAVPYVVKAAAAGTLATAAVIAAPETGGTSLAGLAPALTVLFTAPDMIEQGAKDEIMTRYMQLKQENPNADEKALMDIAEHGELSGGLLGAANALAYTTTLKLPLLDGSKNVLKKYLNGVTSSAVHLGGITAGSKAAQLAERKIEGYHVGTDDAIKEITETFVEGAKAGAVLNGLMSGAHILPKAVKSAMKWAITKQVPVSEVATVLKANVDAGRLPPEVAEQTIADIDGYKKALDKTADGLKPETEASVAGLIQAKDNLIAEMAAKDETQHEPYKQKIEALNKQIEKITKTNDPFKYEVDELTGNPIAEKPKVEEELPDLSVPIEGTDKKGVPIGEDVPPPNKESIAEKGEVFSGDEVWNKAEKAGSEHEDIGDIEEVVKRKDYKLAKVPIEELIKNDEDLREYLKDNPLPRKGREIEQPIIVADVSRGGNLQKDGVVDGFHRIAQAMANGETEINAYVQSKSKLLTPKEGGGLSRGDAGSVGVGGDVKQQELDAQKINKEAGVDVYVARQGVETNGEKYTLSQIKENGNTNTFVIEDVNGSEIGKAQLSADGNYLENIRIDEKHRRKGLASKVYDFIELRKGIELKPSPNKQSKEAKSLWDNRNLKKSVSKKVNGGLLAKVLGEVMSKPFADFKNKQQVLLELENKYFEQKGLLKEDFNKLNETEKAEIIKDAVKWKNDNPELVKAVEQSLKETTKAGQGSVGVGGDVETKINKVADEYLYHGTGEGAFRRIREEGLTPQGEKYLYFADIEQYAKTYAQRKGNSFGDRVLRVKKSDAYLPDENTTGGDFKIKNKINPNDIEIKHNGKWIPIQEFADENIGIMPISKAVEQSLKEQPTKPEINNESKAESQADKIPDTKTGDSPIKPETGEAASATTEGKEGGKKPPPSEPTETVGEGKGKDRLNDKGILNHLATADKVPESSKEGFKEKGLKYETKSQKEAEDVAKSVIDEYGIEDAVLLAEAQKFDGDVNSLIYAESLNRLGKMEAEAKTPEEKLAIAKQFAEVGIKYDEAGRKGGRFSSAINYFYKKSPLGIQMMENAKRKEQFEDWAKPKDKSWKEFFDEMVKEPEFDALVKEQVKEGMKQERAEARAERIKKVDAFFDKAKDQFKGGAAYSTIIPPQVITAALEGMKKAYHAGEKVAKLVEDAIDYISNELGGASWDKDKFRKEWEEKLQDKTEKKKLTDEEAKAKILDRFRNKLKGLSDRQKEDVVRKSFQKIVESGGLDYADFRKIIAEVTGRNEMTDAEAAKLKKLVEETNKVDDAATKARTERTPESLKAYREAEVKAGTAQRELNTLLYNRPNVTKRLTSMLQLNTLGVAALVNNPVYNVINQLGIRVPVGVIKTGIDKVIQLGSKALGKEIKPETDVLSLQVQKEFFNKLGLGGREALGQFLTGLNRMDYIQKEIHGQQIRPITSMKELWEFSKGERNLTKAQVFDKLLQALPQGWTAEIIARTLNLGDKPMRFSAEGAQASAFAKSLGVKDIDYKLFIEFPREEAYRVYKNKGLSDAEAAKKADYIRDTIIKEGERSTFQQDNFANDILNRIFGGKDSGVGGLVKATVISPYIKIPANAYWSYFNIVNPEVAMLQSMIYGAKAFAKRKGDVKFSFDKNNSTAAKDLNEAKYWLAHAAVGFATRAVITSLVGAGIFRSANTADDTKKEREGEQFYESQGTVNVDKLWAYMKGEDPSKVKNGLVVQNRWFGHWGSVGNTIAKREEEMTDEQKANRDDYWNEVLANINESALPGLEQGIFGNTSSLLTALNRGGSTMQAWGVNTMNMFTNIIHPAAFAQVSKAQLPYYTKTKADSFREELKNAMLTRSSNLRTLLGQYPPSKISIWGDKIEKGGNGFWEVSKRLFGFSKANDDNFAQPIYEDYKKTDNTKFFPSAVKPEINNGRETIKLPVKEAYRLEELVGQQRKALLAPYANDMAKFEGDNKVYSQLKEEEKLKNLDIIYDEGFKRGKELFIKEFPKYAATKETYSEKQKEKKESDSNKKLRNAIKKRTTTSNY